MTKLQEIRALQKQLPDRTDLIEDMKYHAVDDEWTAHHSTIVGCSDTIGDYQVIRKFDLEIDCDMDWEEHLLETMSENERKRYIDTSGEINLDNLYEDYDPYEEMYHIQFGEYMQIWYNVKDHSIYKLGRINKDPEYCSLKGPWTWLSGQLTARKKAFLGRFDCSRFYDGLYKDITVHPNLLANGYVALDTFDWNYEYIDDSAPEEVRFVSNTPIVNLFESFLNTKSQAATLISLYGKENYFYVLAQEDKNYQKEVIAALRICRRNKYVPADLRDWQDYTKILFDLGKDLHNAHYVCPPDLHEAHQKAVQQANKEKDKVELQRKLREAEKKLDKFIQHMQAFLDLHFESENICIRPLQSPVEYVHEGNAMHHCVTNYQDRYDSLILTARNHNNERIATCEVDLNTYRIIQIRGLQNKLTEYNDEIAILLTKNMSKIRRANKKQKLLTAALKAA